MYLFVCGGNGGSGGSGAGGGGGGRGALNVNISASHYLRLETIY